MLSCYILNFNISFIENRLTSNERMSNKKMIFNRNLYRSSFCLDDRINLSISILLFSNCLRTCSNDLPIQTRTIAGQFIEYLTPIVASSSYRDPLSIVSPVV